MKKPKTLGHENIEVWNKLSEIREAQGDRYDTDVIVKWIEKEHKRLVKSGVIKGLQR